VGPLIINYKKWDTITYFWQQLVVMVHCPALHECLELLAHAAKLFSPRYRSLIYTIQEVLIYIIKSQDVCTTAPHRKQYNGYYISILVLSWGI